MRSVTDNAKIMDWSGNVLREGSNGWTCLPTPPQFPAGTTKHDTIYLITFGYSL